MNGTTVAELISDTAKVNTKERRLFYPYHGWRSNFFRIPQLSFMEELNKSCRVRSVDSFAERAG